MNGPHDEMMIDPKSQGDPHPPCGTQACQYARDSREVGERLRSIEQKLAVMLDGFIKPGQYAALETRVSDLCTRVENLVSKDEFQPYKAVVIGAVSLTAGLVAALILALLRK